jgi:protocatechuate 3,4-dioxygenase beta subunit
MTKPFRPDRRTTLARVATLAAVAALPVRADAGERAPLEPTPPDAEGPFYPVRVPADADADLARVAGRAGTARGTLLYLSGRVLGVDGAPLAGARLELWQCDAHGRYHHVHGDAAGDEGFQGYGVATADAEGRFAFRTIRPVPYATRPPHLHFKLAHERARPLTTQLYPRGESDERFAGFGLSGRTARARLEFALAPATGREVGALEARYDFVLRPA